MPNHVSEIESRRIKLLRSFEILDTPAEQAYDDVVNLASYICGTPIALISLIDEDRQWFKARVGLDATQTPREQAFCGHAINYPDKVMEVQDASLDSRFADNPLVTGDPHIRFYAGAPLVTPSGAALGTVCVIDRVPRELTPAMSGALTTLARQVMGMLTMHREIVRLKQENAALSLRVGEMVRHGT